ncbi:MAG: hypothetical protein AB9835_04930 [Eubacteriales bacterium]
MRVKIGGHTYTLAESFMTAFRFRAKYCKSLLDKSFDENDMLLLIHTAITETDKPYIQTIKEEARANPMIYKIARILYSHIMRTDNRIVIDSTSGGEGNLPDIDEFHAISLYAAARLPEKLLDELSFMQVYALIKVYYETTRPSKEKPRFATPDEVKNLLGVSDEQEAMIQAYLKEHPQERGIYGQ